MLMPAHLISGLRLGRALTRSLALSVAILTQHSPAQILELTQPLKPPEIPQPSFASAMVKTLEAEAAGIQQPGTDDQGSAEPAVIAARADIRLLAAELLASGDRLGAEGGAMFIVGLKIAASREELDSLFVRGVDAQEDACLLYTSDAADE